ncbi:MAG: carboxylesterase [Pseudomonadota bacterium]
MSTAPPSAVEVNPAIAPTATVIALHGLGADGHDLASLVQELDLPARHGVRFVCPHAPHRPITLNNGYVMRAWFDIVSLGSAQREDEAGLRESEHLIHALMRREIDAGIDARRIVLAGFSQGGALALYAGLRYAERLAGLVALSSWLPLAAHVRNEAHPANAGLPIFMGHGMQDTIVPPAAGMRARDALEELGYAVTWRSYMMGHTLCAAEIQDVSNWLTRVLEL